MKALRDLFARNRPVFAAVFAALAPIVAALIAGDVELVDAVGEILVAVAGAITVGVGAGKVAQRGTEPWPNVSDGHPAHPIDQP